MELPMGRYSALITMAERTRAFAGMTPLSPEQVGRELGEHFSSVPDSYRDFLAEVGFGSVGDSRIAIYQGLIRPESIFGEAPAPSKGRYFLFGDDFSGNCFGLDASSSGEVVVMGPTADDVYRTGKTFEQFIKDKILDLL